MPPSVPLLVVPGSGDGSAKVQGPGAAWSSSTVLSDVPLLAAVHRDGKVELVWLPLGKARFSHEPVDVGEAFEAGGDLGKADN